uniref:Uncharacterized protein n=1 Tax=Setaria italica TaxID=4555 RepID=K3YFE1_SETIT
MAWKSLLFSGLNSLAVTALLSGNFQAVMFSPALVWRETASGAPMSCRADPSPRGKKASHMSCGSSADHHSSAARRRSGARRRPSCRLLPAWQQPVPTMG